MTTNQGPRVFVVDDERVIATTLKLILRQSGFDAISFTSPWEALIQARMQCPQLVISDVLMPEMSGIEMAVEMRKLCHGIKVIFLSAQSETAALLEAAGQVSQEFSILTKPVHPTDLLTIVGHLNA
jgi:DNA-binding response OmpR family regulator